MNNRQRALALLAGSAAAASSMAAVAAPAGAVTVSPQAVAIPACNAAQTDAVINAALAKYNVGKTAAQKITQFRGSYLPAAVHDTTRNQNLRWGTYYTRVFKRNGILLKGYVCTYVNEAGISLADQRTSLNTYQKGSLPYLKAAANRGTTGNSMKKAAILARVKTEAVTNLGASASLGAGSSATYSVQGFYYSLQAALIKAWP